jgi:hypothetical protein
MGYSNSSQVGRADTVCRRGRWLVLTVVALAAGIAVSERPFAPPLAASPRRQAGLEASSTPARSRIRLEVLGTPWDQPTGAPQVETRVLLAPGQGATQYIVAGGTEDEDVCRAGFVSAPASLRPVYLWEVDVRVVAVAPTRTTVELRWRRSRPRAPETAVVGDVRTVTLGPGDYHVFDFVTAPPGSTSCANIVLRVLADPLPERLPEPPVTVDLWVAQDDARGRHWARQQVSGRLGGPLSFRLGPLEWALDGTPNSPRSDGTPIRLDVSGTVQPVLRADGQLDVEVAMIRALSLGRARVTGEGRATFTCAFDEAIAIPMPEARGQSRARVAGQEGSPAAPGVQALGPLTVVDFAQFFTAKPTTLYVVVHR